MNSYNVLSYDFETPLDLFGMVQKVRKTIHDTLQPQLSEKNNYYIYWLYVRLKQVFSWEKNGFTMESMIFQQLCFLSFIHYDWYKWMMSENLKNLVMI